VNAGRLGPGGLIEGNRIRDVLGDGIGAWNLDGTVVIAANDISEFGNDGIDVLGSTGAVIHRNYIHHSIDRPGLARGLVHAGIKAGGNAGAGGGGNIVAANVVHDVKNFGIFNREAVGNVYVGNECYRNGVNFNFVRERGPALATVIGNVSRGATFAAGLRYSVFIPGPGDLRSASANTWEGGVVNVKGVGIVVGLPEYLLAMRPLEDGTRF
jgi:hypothetical protein